MTITEMVDSMIASLEDLHSDLYKFDNKKRGSGIASTKIRKAMLKIKNDAQDVRVAIQDTKNARKGDK